MLADIPLDKILAPVFGGLLVVVGAVAMTLHTRSWRTQREDPNGDEVDRSHHRSRYRRRMQVSGMICLVGIMIAVGDAIVPWQRAPALFAVYWLFVLLVAIWIVFLALGDMYATSAYSRVALGRIRAKQRVLEQELAKQRARRGEDGRNNGHA